MGKASARPAGEPPLFIRHAYLKDIEFQLLATSCPAPVRNPDTLSEIRTGVGLNRRTPPVVMVPVRIPLRMKARRSVLGRRSRSVLLVAQRWRWRLCFGQGGVGGKGALDLLPEQKP